MADALMCHECTDTALDSRFSCCSQCSLCTSINNSTIRPCCTRAVALFLSFTVLRASSSNQIAAYESTQNQHTHTHTRILARAQIHGSSENISQMQFVCSNFHPQPNVRAAKRFLFAKETCWTCTALTGNRKWLTLTRGQPFFRGA